MNAPHALFQSIGIPWNVIVKQEDVAALKVDTFACCFGGYEHLCFQLPEIPLCANAGAFFVAGAGLHPAMDLTNRKTPLREFRDQVVESVFIL